MRFGKSLTFFMVVIVLALAVPLWGQQKPLTRDQVQSLVHSGLGDESGAKMVEQRGVDFAPTEDFLPGTPSCGGERSFSQGVPHG